MPTALITGCSSGFGLEAARLFLDRGWNVIATMRTPDPALLPTGSKLRILQLDVTDAESINRAIADAGEIDVLVNNAGFGAPVPVELISPETTRIMFETNTFGTLAMTQAVLPQFRQRRNGVIINVTSSVTLKALPLIGLYRASKAAVDAFTSSLELEVKQFGIRVHLVLPGRSPSTSFGSNARPHLLGLDHPDYGPMIQKILEGFADTSGPVTYASDVAEAIFHAATNPDAPLRIAAGADAVAWMAQAILGAA